MIIKVTKKMFGGKGELFRFRFVREAIAMKNILRNKRTHPIRNFVLPAGKIDIFNGVKFFLALLIVFTLHAQIFTQPVFARGSGGADLSEFKTEKFLTSVGIGIASSVVGNVISSGISMWADGGSFVTGASDAMSSYGSLGSWASSYNSMAALSQLGAAISMTGQQQGWDVSKTTFVSSVAQGIVGGGLNPSGTLGAGANSTIKAIGVGAISGVTEGAILANNVIRSNDSDIHGTQNPWVSFGANLAGSFAGGMVSAGIANVIPGEGKEGISTPKLSYKEMKADNPDVTFGSRLGLDGREKATTLEGNPLSATKQAKFDNAYSKFVNSPVSESGYNAIAKANSAGKFKINDTNKINTAWPVMVKTSTSVTTFNKANGLKQALTHGAIRAFSAIPSSMVSMGVKNITKDMDRQDAFMVRQAFSGVYPIIGVGYQNIIKDPVLNNLGKVPDLKNLGLDNYVGQKNGSFAPSHKVDVTITPGLE